MGQIHLLEYLDFSGNKLYGGIPSSLGNCSRLSYLDLSQNMINGTIPASLLAIQLLEMDLSENKLLGIIPDSFDHSYLLASIGLPVSICMAKNSLEAECKALSGIRHRNLVKLITCCITRGLQGKEFKALRLEFMCNGSLNKWFKWLHPPNPLLMARENQSHHLNLNLLQRLSIALDVASAMEYLHHNCPSLIVHCGLKPSNILLDEDMTAHVGDFGLARILSSIVPSEHQSSTLGLKGSNGYIPPGINNIAFNDTKVMFSI
ncbi:hypothetical protein AMTR_s00029p00235340 [Amborella trichopoda]|uniref:Protein kinase domain-containing protein n=1 Tax=Amborella trichopoda TaxID=13333 RepID=W1PPX0_AMBTC|nr:hypothetical protein AMTR_s00029p00235340 [Amborella trichopoda]